MQFQNLKERKDWHYLTLDNEKLRSSLFNKKSLSSKSKKNYISILLPNERGIAEDFLLVPTSVLSQKIANRFPGIKTYRRSKSRPNVKLDFIPTVSMLVIFQMVKIDLFNL